MLNFVENLLENERDSRSGPMNDQDHSLSYLFNGIAVFYYLNPSFARKCPVPFGAVKLLKG
jgi:hypothetical protein